MTSNRVSHFKRHVPWALAWAVASVIGAWVIAHSELSRLRDTFDNEAYTAQRLISQRMVQLDALITALPAPGAAPPSASPTRGAEDKVKLDQRFLMTYPQVISIQRRGADESWSDDALRIAEETSANLKQPVLTNVNLAKGRYQLVHAADPVSFALLVDIRALVPWREWPMVNDTSPVRVSLKYAKQELVLQPGLDIADNASGWHLVFRQPLNSLGEEKAADKASGPPQTIEFTAERQLGWGDLPWSRMTAWALLIALLLLALRALLRQRHDRYRADGLLRIGQAGQLNTLAELAGGMAQELADPLAAVLDSTQSAERWLGDNPPDVLSAHAAVRQASDDARHLANVVDRLHHVVQQPDLEGLTERISLVGAARSAVDLLQPRWEQLGIAPAITLTGTEFTVLAAPQALAQVIHNLLINAAQALEQVPPQQRSLNLVLTHADGRGLLSLQDTGPGIANNIVTHIFEPFFTTRKGALGLGLSLCETITNRMGGTLTAFNRVPRGAEFCLGLPLAS